MKTYCKPQKTDIENWEANEIAVIECFKKKKYRNDFQRLLCKTGLITKQEIAEDRLNKNTGRILKAERAVTQMLTNRIVQRDLKLKPIREFQRVDGLTQKVTGGMLQMERRTKKWKKRILRRSKRE